MTRRAIRLASSLAVVSALVLAGCSDAGEAEHDGLESGSAGSGPVDQGEQEGDTGQEEVLVAEIDDPIDFPECEEAEAAGHEVTWLGDVVVEEQEIPGGEARTVTVDGEEIEIPGSPAIAIPERVGQAGCAIEYQAPGGCLGGTEISASFIPGYRVPERTLPEVELPDGTVLEELVQEEIVTEAVREEGVLQGEVCQDDPEELDEGDQVSFVRRPFIRQTFIRQPFERQAFERRSSVGLVDGTEIPQQELDQYEVPQLEIPQTEMPQAELPGYRLEGTESTEYADDEESVSYTTEGDVLFDSDQYSIRPDAETELQAIADDIAQRGGDYEVRVEGHTDNLPTSAYADNYELAERRADAVAVWLAENAEVAGSAITTEGLGEDYPRASNDSDEGRQQNRRVVITVSPTP